jgi:hypothetical protein
MDKPKHNIRAANRYSTYERQAGAQHTRASRCKTKERQSCCTPSCKPLHHTISKSRYTTQSWHIRICTNIIDINTYTDSYTIAITNISTDPDPITDTDTYINTDKYKDTLSTTYRERHSATQHTHHTESGNSMLADNRYLRAVTQSLAALLPLTTVLSMTYHRSVQSQRPYGPPLPLPLLPLKTSRNR